MSRRSNPSNGPGPKLDKEQQNALRKEQYGFANLAKEQQFRSTTQGEVKSLHDQIRELTEMLEDRKTANRMLTTENQRLKKMGADLQVQLLDKPTARGESAALKSMRDMARQFQNRQQMTSTSAEKLVSELMSQNQAAMDEMQHLADDRDQLQAELQTTREALSSATSELAAYREELSALTEEKEAVLRVKDQAATEAQQRDEDRLQVIAAREADIEVLKQQLAERDTAVEATRLAGEAALRSQKAVLEAEMQLQRQAAVAELQAQLASLKQLLHKAQESLRSLNQIDALDSGWTITEHGQLPPQGQGTERLASAKQQPPATSPPLPVAAALSHHPRRASRTGNDCANSADGPVGDHSPTGPGLVATSIHQLDKSEGSAAAAGSPKRSSRAGSVAGQTSARPSEAGSTAGAAAGAVTPGSVDVAGGKLVVERAQTDKPMRVDVDANRPGTDGTSVLVATAAKADGEGGGEGTGDAAVEVAKSAQLLAKEELEGAKEISAAALVPAAPTGPHGNVLELLIHDSTLLPGALGLPSTDLWALLRLTCSGLGLLPVHTHLAISTSGATSSSNSTSGTASRQLPLLRALRLHFPDDQRLLTAVAAVAVRMVLYNLKPALAGAVGWPRVVVTPAEAAGVGASPVSNAAADGTLERVLVVASRDEYDCPSLDLYCMDEEGCPTRPLQPLSAPWRTQLPDTVPVPRPDEFCINTQALHRLQADAARASGLFDLSSLRVFIGRGDGHTYQVWRLADVEARRKASFKALDRVLVEPAVDPWVTAAPLAVASLPLTAALCSPSIANLELANVRLLLGGQPVIQMYEPSDGVGTRTLACRTVIGEKVVATVRVTARLAREPQVSEQLLAALQPALQAGSGAPTLSPLHWLSLMGAEELVIERLLRELREVVRAAAAAIMAAPAHDDTSATEVEALGRNAEDAVLLKERQLGDGLAACQVVVTAAAAAEPQEAPLACLRMWQLRQHIAASVAEMAAFFRQRLELYRLGAVSWFFITVETAGRDDPVARLPVTTTRIQARSFANVMTTLTAVLHALTPPDVAAAAELLHSAAPLALLPPPLQVEAVAAERSALSEASKELEAALRVAVDAAATAAREACEEVRQQVAVPGADDVELVEALQRRLAKLAAPVTAALVGGMAGLCQAAVSASLTEPVTVVALREQLLAAASAATVGSPPSLAPLLSGSRIHLVSQLVMQLSAHADAVATADGGALASAPIPSMTLLSTSGGGAGAGSAPPSQRRGGAAASSALQLAAALQSLQWGVGAFTRVAPAPVAASSHSIAAWAKAVVRLRLQLGLLCTAWSATAVAAAGQALLLSGQRPSAVTLALEVMGREVDRALDGTKATLESLRVNRSYDDAVLTDIMPSLATELTATVAAAVTSCFWLATQMLLTPVVLQVFVRPPPSSQNHHLYPHPDSQQQQQQYPLTTVNRAPVESSHVSGSGGSGSGVCYSTSLHVSSRVSFTLVTIGIVRGSGAQALLPPAAASRPVEPSLAPLTQPLLTTWQPRRVVLYMDIARLNAAAASLVAAATSGTSASPESTAPATAPPPPPAAPDTLSLPHLPAALELLGWTLRYADEYYDGHFAAAAAAAADSTTVVAGGDAAVKAASRPPSRAQSTSQLAAPTPRGHASVGGSIAGGEDALPKGVAASALAADPLATLSEAKMAARMAEEADVVVLAGGQLTEAGSLIKWLAQNGMLVLAAADLQQQPAVVVTSGGSSGDAGARELARTLVGLLATHHLQAAAVRTLTQTVSGSGGGSIGSSSQPSLVAAIPHPVPGGRSSFAATPRTSLSGRPGMHPPSIANSEDAIPRSSAAATGTILQPLAVLTYLPDVALAKRALAAASDLGHRVDLELKALQASFAASVPLAPHTAMLARHVSQQLAQQRLLLEGLLMAPELLMARHPGAVPVPGSVAAVTVASGGRPLWQPWGRMSGDATVPATTPALSRQSSLGQMRPSLPAMRPKAGGSSRRTSQTGNVANTTAAAVMLGMPPRPPAVQPTPLLPAADAYSTESEDEEVGVSKLDTAPRASRAVATAAVARSGFGVQGGPATLLLPDEPDADSDVASLPSASTLGSQGGRRRIPQ